MGAMALLPIWDSSFTCEDYNAYRAHPWSLFSEAGPSRTRSSHASGPTGPPRTSPERGCQKSTSLGVSGMSKVKTVHTTVSNLATPTSKLAWRLPEAPAFAFNLILVQIRITPHVNRVPFHFRVVRLANRPTWRQIGQLGGFHASALEGVAKSQFTLQGSSFQTSNAPHVTLPTRATPSTSGWLRTSALTCRLISLVGVTWSCLRINKQASPPHSGVARRLSQTPSC